MNPRDAPASVVPQHLVLASGVCEVHVPDVDLFAELSASEQRDLSARPDRKLLHRGDILIREGDAADALYVVLSGRFSVTLAGSSASMGEIGPGQPVGEIAFLTGRRRTATVTAMRDSVVLMLTRPDFDGLVAKHPDVWSALTTTLARRLADTTSRVASSRPSVARPRTICVVPAGASGIDRRFIERLETELARRGRYVVLTRETAERNLGSDGTRDDPEAIARLNALEAAHDHVLFVADDAVTPWTEKAIRHADLVLAVADHDVDPEPSPVEQLASRFVSPDATRLVLLYPRRTRPAGTARWLTRRKLAMHHHVALDAAEDVARLFRFIEGSAVGFVAAGGGALAAAHTGVYKAVAERGLAFDCLGGTSAGAALAAAFMLESSPEAIDEAMGEMFVANRALRRYTLPRYALLDHTVFDRELQRLFGNVEIEDLWLPFFAVSTNLSLFCVNVHRSGPLWRAIRASASIPVLLPPVYTPEGDMLVDGCLLDNVPVKVMGDLKRGPNVVVSFKPPVLDSIAVDYDALPSRNELMRLVLNPMRRNALPEAPGLITVLMRALMANRRDFVRELNPDDVSLVPPIPPDVGFLDWHRHRELFRAGYAWAQGAIDTSLRTDPPAWLAAAASQTDR